VGSRDLRPNCLTAIMPSSAWVALPSDVVLWQFNFVSATALRGNPVSIGVRCSSCGYQFRRPAALVGKSEKCPECGKVVIIRDDGVAELAETPEAQSAEPGAASSEPRSTARSFAERPPQQRPPGASRRVPGTWDDRRPATAPWVWAFVVLCGLIPVLMLGGVIPVLIAIGGASSCIAIARNLSIPLVVRVPVCAAITVFCWFLLFALLLVVAAASR